MRDIQIHQNVRRDAPLREGFFALARSVFGLDFAPWYQAGWWTGRYIPHVLTVDGQVAANVSVNLIDTLRGGLPRRYIQLGTVMTDPAYRGQGLGRRLMEAVLERWRDACGGMYLYANDSVLDFYPKFGFRPARETVHSRAFSGGQGCAQALDMDTAQALTLLREHYAQGNPFSALPMVDNFGLLMFYCGSFMKDRVRYIPSQDAVVVAEQEGDVLICHDIFCPAGKDLDAILSAAAAPETGRVELGFTPLSPAGWSAAPLREEDTTLFVLAGKEDPFAAAPCRMPSLSHA